MAKSKTTLELVNSGAVAAAPGAELRDPQRIGDAIEGKTPKTTKTGLPKLPAIKRARKPKPPQNCACGCGGQTKGGRFIAGHDARLHGWALRIQRELVTYKDIEAQDGLGVVKAVKAYLAAADTK